MPPSESGGEDEPFRICVNLGQLDAFPSAPDSFNPNPPSEIPSSYRHVKLEIAWTEQLDNGEIVVVKDNWIRDIAQPKKRVEIEQEGEFQPEFHIILPKGWHLDGDSIFKSLYVHCHRWLQHLFLNSYPLIAKQAARLNEWSMRRAKNLKTRISAQIAKPCKFYEGKVVRLYYYFESETVVNPETGEKSKKITTLSLEQPFIDVEDDRRRHLGCAIERRHAKASRSERRIGAFDSNGLSSVSI
jgi:hypothetical protein